VVLGEDVASAARNRERNVGTEAEGVNRGDTKGTSGAGSTEKAVAAEAPGLKPRNA